MNSLTHKFITKTALEQLEIVTDKEILINYSAKPDEDETDGAFMWHFYNPATKKNFKGGRVSALTKLLEHFDNAINLYKINDILFLEELGRACHFIQDMCTPVHTYYEDTFDAVTRLSQHTHFENYVDNLIKKSNFQIVTIDEMTKGMLLNNNLKTFAKYSAMLASEDFYYLDNNEQKGILSIAIDSVNNGIIATCAVLLHFNVEKIGD